MLLAVWLFQKLFPGDEKIIRRRLNELALSLSVKATDPALARIARANKLAEYFSPDVVINLTGVAANFANMSGRDQLLEVIRMARLNVQQAQIELFDISLELAQGSATAHFTALVHLNGEKNSMVQELKVELNKMNGDWVIARADSVKTTGR